jgi:hypothetical protein
MHPVANNLCDHVAIVRFGQLALMPSRLQRMSGVLKVFRCEPQRDGACLEVAARVDKPRKDEAAGVLVRLWGKRAVGRCDGGFS